MDNDTSTSTSADETNLGDNPTRDTLAEGLMGLLKPTVDQLDEKVQATKISQLELKQQIELLTEDLVKINELLTQHPEVESYIKRLVTCKQKVTVVLNVLQTAQERLEETRKLVSEETRVRTAILKELGPIESTPGPSGVSPSDLKYGDSGPVSH